MPDLNARFVHLDRAPAADDLHGKALHRPTVWVWVVLHGSAAGATTTRGTPGRVRRRWPRRPPHHPPQARCPSYVTNKAKLARCRSHTMSLAIAPPLIAHCDTSVGVGETAPNRRYQERGDAGAGARPECRLAWKAVERDEAFHAASRRSLGLLRSWLHPNGAAKGRAKPVQPPPRIR